VRRFAVLLVLALAGCAAQQTLESANKALEGAAVAEKKLADSGSAALSGVAALSSRLGETTEHLNGVLAAIQSDATVGRAAIIDLAATLAQTRKDALTARGTFVELTATVAALRSGVESAQPAVPEIAGILSDVHTSTSLLRHRIETPVPTWVYLAFGGLGLGLLITFVHNVWAHRGHRRAIAELKKHA
jgi:ABC-type transporter Mla subunit MlaD